MDFDIDFMLSRRRKVRSMVIIFINIECDLSSILFADHLLMDVSPLSQLICM